MQTDCTTRNVVWPIHPHLNPMIPQKCHLRPDSCRTHHTIRFSIPDQTSELQPLGQSACACEGYSDNHIDGGVHPNRAPRRFPPRRIEAPVLNRAPFCELRCPDPEEAPWGYRTRGPNQWECTPDYTGDSDGKEKEG